MERDEFVSSVVQDTLRQEITELRKRDERRMPTSLFWGLLIGFGLAIWLID